MAKKDDEDVSMKERLEDEKEINRLKREQAAHDAKIQRDAVAEARRAKELKEAADKFAEEQKKKNR